MSMDTITFSGLRAAGHKDTNSGIVAGGLYYPAIKKNGSFTPARFEFNCFLNRRGWTNSEGLKVEGKSEVVRLVMWNSKKSAPGKGMADYLAKAISVGKELTVQCQVNTFTKRIFIGGTPVINPETNQPLEYPSITFRISGEIEYGDDSAATLVKEIAAYAGVPSFDSRPANWNLPGHADHEAWKNIIMPARTSAIYDGKTATYGYARVIVPEGAVVVTAADLAANNSGQPAAGDLPTSAAQDLTGGAAAGAGNNNFPL